MQDNRLPVVIDMRSGELLTSDVADAVEITDVCMDGVYCFTTSDEYANWLHRRGELEDLASIERFVARARRGEEEGESEQLTSVLRGRQERVSAYNNANLRAHGIGMEELRDPLRMQQILDSFDPTLGPVMASACLFQHVNYQGNQFWLTLYEAWPYLGWMSDRASSLQYFGGSVILWGKKFFRGKKIRFRSFKGFTKWHYVPSLVDYGWNDRASSAAHVPR